VVARYAVDTEAGGHLGEIEIDAGARFVAAGDGDGTTWIWRQADGRLLARIRDHRERVTGLAFDGAGRLWTGSWDGTVRVRSLAALEAPVAELRARIDAAWALSLERVVDAR
jgi:WD40 repeat protein